MMLMTTRPGNDPTTGVPRAFALVLDIADEGAVNALEKGYIEQFSTYSIAGLNMVPGASKHKK